MLQDYDDAIASGDYVKIANLLPRSVTPPPLLSEESTFDDLNDSKGEFTSDPFADEDPFKGNSVVVIFNLQFLLF